MYGRGQAPDPPRSSPRKPCDGMPAQFCFWARMGPIRECRWQRPCISEERQIPQGGALYKYRLLRHRATRSIPNVPGAVMPRTRARTLAYTCQLQPDLQLGVDDDRNDMSPNLAVSAI